MREIVRPRIVVAVQYAPAVALLRLGYVSGIALVYRDRAPAEPVEGLRGVCTDRGLGLVRHLPHRSGPVDRLASRARLLARTVNGGNRLTDIVPGRTRRPPGDIEFREVVAVAPPEPCTEIGIGPCVGTDVSAIEVELFVLKLRRGPLLVPRGLESELPRPPHQFRATSRRMRIDMFSVWRVDSFLAVLARTVYAAFG